MEMEIREYIKDICQNAKEASKTVALLSTKEKNRVISLFADKLMENADHIIRQNSVDIAKARENGISEAMTDRLLLTRERLEAISSALYKLTELDDPIGCGEISLRPNGLEIKKISVPLGTVGVIYESRPNVSADIAGLCLKSGNAVVLRGGKEAINSNKAIVEAAHMALEECKIPTAAVSLIAMTDREGANAMMEMRGTLDALIPRGGKGLIKNVVENSKVPVIETGAGNCHLYIHGDADIDMALNIAYNAKMSRPSVCNAIETILVNEDIAPEFLPKLKKVLDGCEIRGCEKTRKYIDCLPATEEDYETEYDNYIVAVKTVASHTEAVSHINYYSTHHSEAIVTNDIKIANYFTSHIDSACVYVNASTRFTDGGEFGLGAEVGISTQKLHARGPMGLSALTTTKYVINGDGQVR